MARITRQTVLSKAEATCDGAVNIQLSLLLLEGKEVISTKIVRYAVSPDTDPRAEMPSLADYIASTGYPPLSDKDQVKLEAAWAFRDAMSE